MHAWNLVKGARRHYVFQTARGAEKAEHKYIRLWIMISSSRRTRWRTSCRTARTRWASTWATIPGAATASSPRASRSCSSSTAIWSRTWRTWGAPRSVTASSPTSRSLYYSTYIFKHISILLNLSKRSCIWRNVGALFLEEGTCGLGVYNVEIGWNTGTGYFRNTTFHMYKIYL